MAYFAQAELHIVILVHRFVAVTGNALVAAHDDAQRVGNVLSIDAKPRGPGSVDFHPQLDDACRQRDEHFGNARLVRNCFEGVINAQANRLAQATGVNADALARLESEDLISPADTVRESFLKSGRNYTVHCEHCGAIYSWSPDMNLREAICDRCGKIYDAEFGQTE